MWLIVGLGNPGRKYQFTRHNIGFRVIDRLSRDLSIPLNKKSLLTKWGKGTWRENELVLAKPQTFMNLSGEAVIRLVNFFKIKTKNLIVIYDDLDLGLGEIRIREKGGGGGHKGVESIIHNLKTSEFIRVRLGIGRPDKKGSEKDYVLETFDDGEKKIVNEQIAKGKEAVEIIIGEGTASAMNRFNRKKSLVFSQKGGACVKN